MAHHGMTIGLGDVNPFLAAIQKVGDDSTPPFLAAIRKVGDNVPTVNPFMAALDRVSRYAHAQVRNQIVLL